MDRITKTLLTQFAANQSLQSQGEPDQFERFCIFCIASKFSPESLNIEDHCPGGGSDGGIDGIVAVVNGAVITDSEEIERLAQLNRYLDAKFIFIQAKTSSSFDGGEFATFKEGVEAFAGDDFKPGNAIVAEYRKIFDAVIDRSGLIKSLSCSAFYVCTGRTVIDQSITKKLRKFRSDLLEPSLFHEVSVDILGAKEIQALYRNATSQVQSEFTFQHKTVIPEMLGVTEAYLGVLPAAEFLKIVTDSNGNIRRSVFYDNVRDYQGDNEVNQKMRATLSDPAQSARFGILNNGITVVTRELRVTGNKFRIEDYQVVNGCQTSHVLFQERSKLTDSVLVPVRIVCTSDEAVTSQIIKATNSQTEVKREQLVALSDFQKQLEAFFNSFEAEKKLFYERRSGQFSSQDEIERTRIVSMSLLVRCFVAMYKDQPHKVTKNFTSILDEIGVDVFSDKHQSDPYYTAAFANYRLEFLFRNQKLDAAFKPARYHILMAFRHRVVGQNLPVFESKKITKVSDQINAKLWSGSDVDEFRSVCDLIRKVGGGAVNRDEIRTQPFTTKLLAALNQA